MYNDYKGAEEEVQGILLTLESSFLKTEVQLKTIRKIWDTLDQRLQDHFASLLQHLENKLQNAVSKLEKFFKADVGDSTAIMARIDRHKASIKRLRFIFCKESMLKMIEDLKKWQEEFDPSWYIMTLIADPIIDKSLQDMRETHSSPTGQLQRVRNTLHGSPAFSTTADGSSIFLNSNSLSKEREIISPLSQIVVASCDDDCEAVIDTVSYASNVDTDLALKHVRDLARVLSTNDPSTSGLLTCRGVVKVVPQLSSSGSSMSFEFVFAVPDDLHSPKLLRDVLLSKASHPLEERFHLAKSLARSVMFVHTAGFVHKNLRPDTVIVFESKTSNLRRPYLVGFERFRPAASGTTREGDSFWEKNIYRHPRRQGLCPEDYYKMQHDIYSLGICLLEIGLWTSFVIPDGSGFKPELQLDLDEALSMKDRIKGAFEIKQKMTNKAASSLPGIMGSKYANLVESCLTCLDPDETNRFGKKADLQDEDGIIVGIQYIEKVRG